MQRSSRVYSFSAHIRELENVLCVFDIGVPGTQQVVTDPNRKKTQSLSLRALSSKKDSQIIPKLFSIIMASMSIESSNWYEHIKRDCITLPERPPQGKAHSPGHRKGTRNEPFHNQNLKMAFLYRREQICLSPCA